MDPLILTGTRQQKECVARHTLFSSFHIRGRSVTLPSGSQEYSLSLTSSSGMSGPVWIIQAAAQAKIRPGLRREQPCMTGDPKREAPAGIEDLEEIRDPRKS